MTLRDCFTWRDEDPSTWKILEGETTFRLVYIQKFRSEWFPSGEGKLDEIVGFQQLNSRPLPCLFFCP